MASSYDPVCLPTYTEIVYVYSERPVRWYRSIPEWCSLESQGTKVVYTAWCLSLAVLETLVHNRGKLDNLEDFFVNEIDFDDRHMERVSVDQLPSHWNEPYHPPNELAEIGQHWAKSKRLAILAVPSIVIASEWNYLFNPKHPDFASFLRRKPRPFSFDPCLLQS